MTTTKIGGRLEPYGCDGQLVEIPPVVDRFKVASQLDAIDLFQIAKQRAQYAKENIDQLLWEIDDNEEWCWQGIAILGQVNDLLRSLYPIDEATRQSTSESREVVVGADIVTVDG